MKKIFTLVIASLITAAGCYGQVKETVKKTPPGEAEERWDDISIDVPPTAEPDMPQDGNTIYDIAGTEVIPGFPGGKEAFFAYLDKNIRKDLLKDAPLRSYKVFVSFIVEKDGSMSDIRILRDPGYGLGREAERALKGMKQKWTPAMLNGKPVRTRFPLPITVAAP